MSITRYGIKVTGTFISLLDFRKISYMTTIWQQIKDLFQSVEESSPSQPALHALIERSAAEQQDYDFWKDSLVCQQLMDWVHAQYAIYLVDVDAIEESMDFLNTPSAKGFVVHFFKTQYSRRDALHFLDYLKDCISERLNYRKQMSDTRTYNRPTWIENTQRHYLKPRIDFAAETFNQQYGNILIELILRDDKPYQLKLQATNYNDKQYTTAGEFKDLMAVIFD